MEREGKVQYFALSLKKMNFTQHCWICQMMRGKVIPEEAHTCEIEKGSPNVIVKLAHISQRMKTDPWNDHKGRAEITLKMWEEQGKQRITEQDKKFWKNQLENNPVLNGQGES